MSDLEEDAFVSGFNSTDITPVEPEPETEQKVEPVVEVPKSVTDADLKAAMDTMGAQFGKNLDRVFGTIGEVKQKLKDLEVLKEKATGISPKARERLEKEFPELKSLLFDDEEETLVVKDDVKAPPVTDEPVIPVQTSEQSLEKRLLKRDHPDWEQVAYSPEFIAWTGKLPPTEQETLRTSWDADFVSNKITEFKASKQSTVERQTKDNKTKKERLDSAVVPRGMATQTETGSDADDEEAAMEKAYRGRSR
ncbi:MAG: hypothetical protein WC373_09565 [Smithella sp.]|jgi:hypothetical protein